MIELGFGAVLEFNIREYPGYLAYRVLKSLNLARCEIPLSGGDRLTLDEEDVHLTLGFPRGRIQIARKEEYQSNFEFNDMVAARCKKSRYKLNATDVANMIKDETDGGPVFKRLFMFLLENALMETPSDGNCKPKILHFIDDVEAISDMNWCGYVLSVLEVTYPGWDKGDTAYFTGPIHFLLVGNCGIALYVTVHALLFAALMNPICCIKIAFTVNCFCVSVRTWTV